MARRDVYEYKFDGTSLALGGGGWTLISTGTPTTEEHVGGSGGSVTFDLAATNEQQVVGIHHNDLEWVDPAKAPIMTFTLQVSTALTTGSFWEAGLVTPHASMVNANYTSGVWFRSAASDNSLLVESDDTATRVDDDDSTVNLTAATDYDFKLDLTDPADVGVYYRLSAGSPAWTQITTSTYAVHATNLLQPIFHMSKAAGTTVGGITIKNIRITQDVL